LQGDNGLWQPDYSDVIGGVASSQVSRLYYPYTSRPYLRAWHDVLLGFGGRAEDHLMEQFILSHITTHARRAAATPQPILREGTAVSLISVEDLSAKKAGDAGPIDFVLAADLQVDGVTVAKVGAEASGQVTYASETGGDGEGMRVGLDRVRLKVGNAEIPLRTPWYAGVAEPCSITGWKGRGGLRSSCTWRRISCRRRRGDEKGTGALRGSAINASVLFFSSDSG